MADSLLQRHFILLKDKVRMDAYQNAIKETVHEGDTVLDIGCGLGILSYMALKAGAAHVYAVEVDPQTFNLARIIAKNSGFDKKVTLYKGLSAKIKLKNRVNVIVSELFGNLSLNENILPVLIDARERLLKDGGTMVPKGTKVWFAPCENKDWEYTCKFMHNIQGIDMLPDAPEVDLGVQSVIIKNTDLLADSRLFAEIDFMTARTDIVSNALSFDVARDGVLTGFAGWFEGILTDRIRFTTTPSGLTTHWKQGFLPLRVPEKVTAGQKIKLDLEIAPDKSGLQSVIGYRYEIRG